MKKITDVLVASRKKKNYKRGTYNIYCWWLKTWVSSYDSSLDVQIGFLNKNSLMLAEAIFFFLQKYEQRLNRY